MIDLIGAAQLHLQSTYMGGYAYAGGPLAPQGLALQPRDRDDEEARLARGDRHLRSVRALTGYSIHARDGRIGHVADFLLEDGDWSIHYLVVDTHDWWPGK